ncbi:MAG TPA: tetratricopeptide repeat protein [Steroidobacteraceae bacterium]|nr:tetratricopeptide repeat protein [Steroidobacteraceae bacterium]
MGARALALLFVIGFTACSSSSPPKEAAAPVANDVSAAATQQPQADPPEAIADYERAMQLMSAGDTAGAERALKQLADKYPAYAGPLINLAILHSKAGRNADAESELKQAIQRNPSSAPAHNQLGILYRKLGRFKEADDAYQQAVRSDPNYALAHLNLGVLYDLYLEQPQRALESYERYLQLEPNPQPKVQGWVKELRTRLGVHEPAAAEAAPAVAPPSAPGAGA